jgi:catalase
MREGIVPALVAVLLGSASCSTPEEASRDPLVAAAAAPEAAPATPAAAAEPPSSEGLAEAMFDVFKPAPGLRPSHARGLCATGTFTPTPEAAALSAAPHLAGPVPALVRLSAAGAGLKSSDKARTARGMAVRFRLPDGSHTDMVMISAPVFGIRDPADFVAFVESRRPDPATGRPDPAKVEAFNKAHPDTQPQIEWFKTAPVPASYAHAPFWGINTFVFVTKDGKRQPARWVVEPVAGVVGLSEEQLKSMPDQFLAAELQERLARGPVAWDFHLQLPEAGDPLHDATAAWPADRRKVRVGRLAITSADPADNQGECHQEMFDPLVLPEGIEPSEDPILLVRSGAYAVSLGRRQEP